MAWPARRADQPAHDRRCATAKAPSRCFPNGTITALANLSKQFAYAVVDVRVAYNENMDRVTGTMREVGASMERDPPGAGSCSRRSTSSAIESLADGFATVRVKFKSSRSTRAGWPTSCAGGCRQGSSPAASALRALTLAATSITSSRHGDVDDTGGRRHSGRPARLSALVAVCLPRRRAASPPDARGLGRRVRLHTKGWLPYTLQWEFEVVESTYPYRLRDRGERRFRGPWRVDLRRAWFAGPHHLRLADPGRKASLATPFVSAQADLRSESPMGDGARRGEPETRTSASPR